MTPHRWVMLDMLPTLPSGKVDRAALPAPASTADVRRTPPSTDAELLVADAWSGVLRGGKIWAEDDFFALGGHSIAATTVAARLTAALGLPVSVRLLFDRPVLADLAIAVEELVLADLGDA